MDILSLNYIYLVSVCLILFYICPRKFQWSILLAASCLFYMYVGIKAFLIIICSVFLTWSIACGLQRFHDEEKQELSALKGISVDDKKALRGRYKLKRKRLMLLGVFALLGTLFFLKYINLFMHSFFMLVGDASSFSIFNLIQPLGISFYSLTTIGYLLDVYRGTVFAQKNPLKLMLFVMYFPHAFLGPIARYNEMSPQLYSGKDFELSQIALGFERILYGVFKKLVIADNIARLVSNVYADWHMFNGFQLAIAIAMFSIQIYADFSGCIDIVSGVSQMFGVKLQPNFRRPYFARSMPEFWRRWHISLGLWFKDFVYYPVSVSKLNQSVSRFARKYFGNATGRIIAGCIPIFFVWISTGLWHGAEWKFVAWGFFHGSLIMLSLIFSPLFAKINRILKIKPDEKWFRLFQILRTFLLCCIGRVFFRSPSISSAIAILKKIFCAPFLLSRLNAEMLYSMGFARAEYLYISVFMLIMLFVSIIQEKSNKDDILVGLPFLLRLILSSGVFVVVLLFGVFDVKDAPFLYAQF